MQVSHAKAKPLLLNNNPSYEECRAQIVRAFPDLARVQWTLTNYDEEENEHYSVDSPEDYNDTFDFTNEKVYTVQVKVIGPLNNLEECDVSDIEPGKKSQRDEKSERDRSSSSEEEKESEEVGRDSDREDEEPGVPKQTVQQIKAETVQPIAPVSQKQKQSERGQDSEEEEYEDSQRSRPELKENLDVQTTTVGQNSGQFQVSQQIKLQPRQEEEDEPRYEISHNQDERPKESVHNRRQDESIQEAPSAFKNEQSQESHLSSSDHELESRSVSSANAQNSKVVACEVLPPYEHRQIDRSADINANYTQSKLASTCSFCRKTHPSLQSLCAFDDIRTCLDCDGALEIRSKRRPIGKPQSKLLSRGGEHRSKCSFCGERQEAMFKLGIFDISSCLSCSRKWEVVAVATYDQTGDIIEG